MLLFFLLFFDPDGKTQEEIKNEKKPWHQGATTRF